METLNLFQDYMQAWKHRNVDTLIEALGPYGSYEDPLTQGALSEDTLRDYLAGLWTVFPDLAYDISAVHRADDRHVHATCDLTGTHSGTAGGARPSGRALRVNCMAVFETSAIGLRHVKVYFDSAELLRQLGQEKSAVPLVKAIRRLDPAAAVLQARPRGEYSDAVMTGARVPQQPARSLAKVHRLPSVPAGKKPPHQRVSSVSAPKKRRAS